MSNVATKTVEAQQPEAIAGKRRLAVTIGIMTGLLLFAMEVTVVATAMPKIVVSLGGFEIYSWVISIYLLTSTVGIPIWGKLSDLYGRRSIYQIGIAVFLIGSILCGCAQSMFQLIIFRAIQGLGGGMLGSMALTIVGDIFTLQERPRIQAVMSAVWGFSSILGPLVGGMFTDFASWRWIFFINIPIGMVAVLLISIFLSEPQNQNARPKIDIAGACTFTIAVSLLLLGCMGSKPGTALAMGPLALAGSAVFIAAFIYIEYKSSEPLLPLQFFRKKIFLATVLGNLLAGSALFGSMPFITLFAQGVQNASATKSGTLLIPLVLGWVTLSVIGAKIMLKTGFRPVVIGGMLANTLGFGLLCLMSASASKTQLYISMGVIGMGTGLALTSLLIAVQSSVARNQLGVVTSAAMFFRNIGGSIGSALMGVLMSNKITEVLLANPQAASDSSYAAEIAKIVANINYALDPQTRGNISATVLDYFRIALAEGIQVTFIFCLILAICAFASSFLVPSESLRKE